MSERKKGEDILKPETEPEEKTEKASEKGGLSEQSAELMELAMERLRKELANTKKSIPLNQLTSAICTLYEKCTEGEDETDEGESKIEVEINVVE